MIKRIFILCTLLLATAYLILAVTTFNSKPADQVCKGMELTVKDSIDYGFVTDKEVKEILKKGKIYPEGKQLSSINVRQLEELLSSHPFIENAECYLTSGGKVAIDIYQRVPVMRVMSSREIGSCSCCNRIHRPQVCPNRIIPIGKIPTIGQILGITN